MTAKELVVSALAEHRYMTWGNTACACGWHERAELYASANLQHESHVVTAILSALGIEQVGCWVDGKFWDVTSSYMANYCAQLEAREMDVPEWSPVYRLKGLED